MKQQSIFKIFLMAMVAIMAIGCTDEYPTPETLPSPKVAFEYTIVDNSYQLDYYVGASIQFVNTSYAAGNCVWEFGDGNSATGDTVIHKYTEKGTYNVRLTVEGVGFVEHNIYIADIRPIVTINPMSDEFCEVRKTYISFNVVLPNPEGLEEEYYWTFPEGTVNSNQESVEHFIGRDPGNVQFSNVGSQSVTLIAKLGGRQLQESKLNVQVGYYSAVPTLYYAVKSGNISALKLISDAPSDLKNMPFDMGVKSGQHALNILFNDTSLYVIDCGKQFTYIDDADGNMGDGKIFVMSKDGSKVETMLTNNGAAFEDPFYGYIEGNNLYFADRNTGISVAPLSTRNASLDHVSYPYYVSNNHLGYYGRGISYGAMNACFGKINNVWYWLKTYNGQGIFRFSDSDILTSERVESDPAPAAGVALTGMMPKSFVWDAKNQVIYFTLYDQKYEGLYRCTLDQLEAIGSNRDNLKPYKCTFADGNGVTPITEPGVGEGSTGEFIGICQLALDPSSGCVYFGLRSADASVKSGLLRYNPTSGHIEYVIKGIEVYGVAINSTPTKLF